MTNYTGSEGILSRFGVKSGVMFQHGEDPNRKMMSALAIAAMLATTISSTAMAMQPPTISEQAPTYSQVVQMVKSSPQQATLTTLNKDGVMVTLSAEQAAPISQAYAKQLEQSVSESLAIFQKTKSWDMVMSSVVAPGLKSNNPLEVQAAIGVLNFYHYSAQRSGGQEVTPAANDAAAYIQARGPALEQERAAAEALTALNRASQDVVGEITAESLASALEAVSPGAYQRAIEVLGSPDQAIEKLAYFQEYQLSILNQASQYQSGAPGQMIDSVDAQAGALSDKYPFPLMVEDYAGDHDAHEMDYLALQGATEVTQVRDSFSHPEDAQAKLLGTVISVNQFQHADYSAPRI